jgi:phenylalanyl-tRNA synthetase alpha chain
MIGMLERLTEILAAAEADLAGVTNETDLQAWKVRHLGRSAPLGDVLDGLRALSKEERPAIGKRANEVKTQLERAFAARQESLEAQALQRSLLEDRLDVSLPGRPPVVGRLHPATQTLREVYAVWAEMGFQVYRSGDVESDEYNFELLNIPAHHPAREMWDTFYTTTPGVLLRTHTSPGQIRVMRERAPEPIRVILPGMCYRYEQTDASHEFQFNQVEGLAVGKGITFADLKGTLTAFARRMFGDRVHTRFRADHFPFTEPSAEMAVECFLCHGEGCGVCKHTGWIEILGCGVVHPTVLRNGGYDPAVFSGFAFGMGTERITMLKHRIDDIRAFWTNDVRFLEQF